MTSPAPAPKRRPPGGAGSAGARRHPRVIGARAPGERRDLALDAPPHRALHRAVPGIHARPLPEAEAGQLRRGRVGAHHEVAPGAIRTISRPGATC